MVNRNDIGLTALYGGQYLLLVLLWRDGGSITLNWIGFGITTLVTKILNGTVVIIITHVMEDT